MPRLTLSHLHRRHILPTGAVALTCVALGGCVTLAEPLRGDVSALRADDAAASVDVGARVRWGGVLVGTEPQQARTCFEVLSLRLDPTGRPVRDSDDAHGRFVACRTGFYDPALFAEGREVSFVGRIDGVELRRIGDYDARLPRIEADVVLLWPRRSQVDVVPVPVPARPWPWWGWW